MNKLMKKIDKTLDRIVNGKVPDFYELPVHRTGKSAPNGYKRICELADGRTVEKVIEQLYFDDVRDGVGMALYFPWLRNDYIKKIEYLEKDGFLEFE